MRVKHAYESPRIKPDHIPVLQRVLHVLSKMSDKLEEIEVQDPPSFIDYPGLIKGWIKEMDSESIINCLRGVRNATQRKLQKSRGKEAQKGKVVTKALKEVKRP